MARMFRIGKTEVAFVTHRRSFGLAIEFHSFYGTWLIAMRLGPLYISIDHG